MKPFAGLRPLMALCLALTSTGLAMAGGPLSRGASKFDPALARALESSDAQVRVLVIAREAPGAEAVTLEATSPTARRRSRADASTAAIRELLAAPGLGIAEGAEAPASVYLWAVNGVATVADRERLEALADEPSVDRILLDRTVPVLLDGGARDPDPDQGEGEDQPRADEPANPLWGLLQIGTKEARQKGWVGQGVRVGIIDTGIDAAHPDLQGKVEAFRDFSKMTVEDGKLVGTPGTEPYDDQGHGTHCAGTVAGAKTGVAPGAKLLIGKAMNAEGGGSLVGLLLSMQWMLDPDGDPSTDDQPDLVSNSWGMNVQLLGEHVGVFRDLVKAWRQAGILPVFAAGNDGPQTACVPGGYPEAFSVGATDHHDKVTEFSTGGPIQLDGETFLKPDVAAPGARIASTYPGGEYAVLDGTSMACPHVAGALAVAKGVVPGATHDQLQKAFEGSAKDLGEPGRDGEYGEGRIDLMKAIERLQAGSRPTP